MPPNHNDHFPNNSILFFTTTNTLSFPVILLHLLHNLPFSLLACSSLCSFSFSSSSSPASSRFTFTCLNQPISPNFTSHSKTTKNKSLHRHTQHTFKCTHTNILPWSPLPMHFQCFLTNKLTSEVSPSKQPDFPHAITRKHF